MDLNEYLKERVDSEIAWYNKRSKQNQHAYKLFRIVEIICASSIPFFAGFMPLDLEKSKILIGSLGIAVSISTAIIHLYKFHENWISYRTTSETLRREKILFQTKAAPYDENKDAFGFFVTRIESIISKENFLWEKCIKRQDKASGSEKAN